MSKFHWALIITVIIVTSSLLWLENGIWVAWIALIALSILIMIMSLSIRSNFFLKAQHKLNSEQVMLSFDDGPHPEYTPVILNTLKEKGVKAMFFLIGKNIEKYPELAKRIRDEGHLLGGHSYSHDYSFGFTVGKKLKNEINKAQVLVSELIEGKAQYFRPPFGVTNPNIAARVKKSELKTIGWSVRSFDTVADKKEDILNKVLGEVRSGDIVLLHDTKKLTAEVLPYIIDAVRNKGMEFGLIEE